MPLSDYLTPPNHWGLWLGRNSLIHVAEDVTMEMICAIISMACEEAWKEGI